MAQFRAGDWHKRFSSKGGKSKSKAKAEAARKNAKKALKARYERWREKRKRMKVHPTNKVLADMVSMGFLSSREKKKGVK